MPPPADVFILGLLNDNHQKDIFIYVVPIFPNEQPHAVHPAAAASLKVIELVRDAGISLGVLSLPLAVHNAELPLDTVYLTAHREVDGPNGTIIGQDDVMSTLGDLRLNNAGGTILWLRVRGRQQKPLEVVFDQILKDDRWLRLDKRLATETLRTQFTNTFNKSAKVCELSGETLALELMHLIPLEMGSGLYTALLDAVQAQADRYWGDSRLRPLLTAVVHDAANPVIGDVSLIPTEDISPELAANKLRSSLVKDELWTINDVANIIVGSTSLHGASDDHDALLLGTNPPVWIESENSLFSFTQTLPAHSSLPSAPPFDVNTSAEVRRFFVRSLVDTATIYRRFSTTTFRQRCKATLKQLKTELDSRKKIQKAAEAGHAAKRADAVKHAEAEQKRKQEEQGPEEMDEGKPKKKKKKKAMEKAIQWCPDEEDETGLDGGGPPADSDDEMDGAGEESGGGASDGRDDQQGRAPDGIQESASGGNLSTSSSGGTDHSGLSLVASDALSLTEPEDGDEDQGGKNTSIDLSPTIRICNSTLDRLFLTKEDLEYDERTQWMPLRSKELLQKLFNVLEPGLTEVEAFGKINEKAEIFFSILINLIR